MHCSAFHKLSTTSTSTIYPYDDNLPKVIINPVLNYLTTPQIVLVPSNFFTTQEYKAQVTPHDSPKSVITPDNKFNIVKEEIKQKTITAAKNNIKHTIEFQKAVKKYQLLEKSKVLCLRCQNNVSMIECFNYRDCAYICLKCASEVFKSITQLGDWEKRCTNESSGCYRCDRLKHSKELYSYIRYSIKKNDYELCSLCLYCRNVKKCEYLMSKTYRRRINNKIKLLY